MAISYPTGLDNFTNPTGADTLATTPHSTHHANLNDAVEALETRVGITGSADATSLTKRIAVLEASSAPFANDITEKLTATSFCSFNRKLGMAVMSRTSQRLYISAFWSPLSFTCANATVIVDTIGTTSTSTLLGLYSMDGADAGTLIASTANDTVFFNTNGVRTKAFSVAVALTAGNRYAFAVLQDGGTQATLAKYNVPNAVGSVNAAFTVIPAECGHRVGQTTLAAFTKADLVANPEYMYFSLSA